jgi:phosphopantothenoylcysteine synthetase/decarboxylase
MDLKKKYETAKKKLREKTPEIIAIATIASSIVGTGAALYYKNKYEVAEGRRRYEKKNLDWMWANVKDEPKMLSYDKDDRHFYLDPLPTNED